MQSPYIIKLMKVWRNKTSGKTYLFLEYCLRNLKQEIKTTTDKKQLLKLFDDVVQGMDALFSKNIIHRDLKFENILIGVDGRAKITDFGLAKDMGYMSNVASVKCGTPYTMAP